MTSFAHGWHVTDSVISSRLKCDLQDVLVNNGRVVNSAVVSTC